MDTFRTMFGRSEEVKMRPFTAAFAGILYVVGFSPIMAQQAALQIPQSIRHEHQQIISRLESFAAGKDKETAAAAQKAATFLKGHYATEEQFVLPPLGLLPRIAKGEISKDMEPAVAMADRTKSALADFGNDHIKITSLMNDLIAVGKKKKDEDIVRLATRVAAQSLNDIEVNQPTAILIGDYLRPRFSRP
jgi:hypothetical protein